MKKLLILVILFCKITFGQTFNTKYYTVDFNFTEKDYAALIKQLHSTKTLKAQELNVFMETIFNFNGGKSIFFKSKRVKLSVSDHYMIIPFIIGESGIGLYYLDNIEKNILIPFLKFEDTLYLNNVSNPASFLNIRPRKYDLSNISILIDFVSKYNGQFSEELEIIYWGFIRGIRKENPKIVHNVSMIH